jgi:outer membrane receptor protein involved in Fe transport
MLISEDCPRTKALWHSNCAPLIAALLFALPAAAQQPANLVDPELDPEEIPIAGETDPDAPPAGTAFLTSDLHEMRIRDVADLADYAPNLAIDTSFAATNPTVYIRGLGFEDDYTHGTGAVAVYQDGININSPAIHLSSQTFDLEAVEVLRGPQGSVNAHNASAGAVLFRSARPDGEFGVSANLTYGNYDAKEVEAAVDIPLIEDVLSMRVSGRAQWRDGYTKNQCAGFDPTRHGFPDPNQGPTTELYESLIPVGTYENGVLRPVMTQRENGRPIFEDPITYVFLDYDAAVAASQIAGPIKPGSRNNPRVLAEDLFDIDGNLVAPAGTRVAGMDSTFKINETAVDGICYMKAPGTLSTLRSENPLPGDDPFILHEEGFWTPDSLQPGSSTFAGLDRWTNDVDNWAARMVVLFEPLDNMEWMFNAHGSQNRGDSAHLQMLGANVIGTGGFVEWVQNDFSENSAAQRARNNPPAIGEGWRDVKGLRDNPSTPGQGGGDPFSGFYDQDGTEHIDAWGINGHGILDLGAVVISLLYDYEWYDRVIEDEGDATPLRINPAVRSDSAWQTTTDLRIEGEGERYHWTAGFFFLYEELTSSDFLSDTQEFQIDQGFDQKLTSLAPYLAGEFDLVEEGAIPGVYALTLSGGVRYNREKKEYTLSSRVTGPFSAAVILEFPEISAKKTWHEPTGDVQLSYTPFSNAYGSLLSYLRYGRGFKNGHFNKDVTISGGDPVPVLDPVEPEYNDALEFGVRTHWFDDRVIFNAALFRYWYRDLQVFDIVNSPGRLPTRKLFNGDADVRGAELELHLRPLPGLLISGNMGWLDSEYEDLTVIKTIPIPRFPNPIPVEFDYTGNSLVNAPEWNLAVFAEYELPLFGWGFLIPHYDANYRSKTYHDPQMLDPISQEGYWLHNARIAYRTPDGQIELAFWVRNLFEEEYKLDTFDQSRTANSILELWAPPRTYGVTLSLNW